MANAEILMVTADEAVLTSLRPILEERGHTVRVCATTREALQIVNTNNIAIAILDLVLPGQDGRRLVVDLRSDAATASMPILAMGPLPAEQENGLVHTADVYLKKPVTPAEVLDRIARYLKRGQECGREARRDQVTGLPNRAAFCELYERTAAKCAANHEPVALAILGIHRFEALVQDCGAVSQDDLIRRIGATVSLSFRATDTVARWSLTEFAILLPGENLHGADRALEKALGSLNRLPLPGADGKEHLASLCAGRAILQEKTPLDEAVAQAERHLYESFAACQTGGGHMIPIEANPTARRPELIAICVADINMGRAIGQMLERDRFTIKLFATSVELLDELSKTRFNLLIADDDLTVAGGRHILERIRILPLCDRLRIIMLVAGESSIVRAMELGANDYAIKPQDITSFISRIRRLLSGGEALLQHHTVMIVDHEIPQLLIAGTTLHRRCGFKVFLAHGLDDALHRLADCSPDILILDLDVPDLIPKTFISRIPRNRHLEIITASASSDKADELDTGSFRARGHLTRPFKPDSLLKEFRGLVPMAGEPPKTKGTDTDAIDIEIQRVLTRRR